MSENLIGATTAVFPIRLSVAVASPVDVEWATRDGSAVAGSDYKATAGTVTFLPGETEKQIEVQVYGQAITPSDDKVFFIRLNPPSNAVLVDAVLTCTINIIDDQGIPSVAVVVAEGRRGPKGDPGLSAYEQAVLMGYTGTLTEWMDQIADASKAADRAGDHAVSASEDALKAQEDALKAQNAAKNAVFAGVVFPTAAEGVDPVLGVQNGAYFNVRSPLSEHYIDEYQNVNGVAVATGKSYPTSDYVQDISEYIALPFVLETVYKLNQRVVLTNGYIVKSTVDGNTNNPNVDMTGWVYSSLTPSHNLSDVDDKAEARTNLDVYSKSEVTSRVGLPIGNIRWFNGSRSQIEDGEIALDGTTVLKRADYPELWAYIQAYQHVITDAEWVATPLKRSAFSSGDGSTTFRLADMNGKYTNSLRSPVLRGDGYYPSGIALGDAIREIEGHTNYMSYVDSPESQFEGKPSLSGAFYAGAVKGYTVQGAAWTNPNSGNSQKPLAFKASLVVPTANENRPNSIFGVYVIKAMGVTQAKPNEGQYPTLTGGNTWNGGQSMTDLTVSGGFNANIKPLLNASGVLPIYALRSWGVVEGTATPARLVKGGNIASVVDEGVGQYKITFATPMPDLNYGVLFGSTTYTLTDAGTYGTMKIGTKTVNGFIISCGQQNYVDVPEVSFGVIY